MVGFLFGIIGVGFGKKSAAQDQAKKFNEGFDEKEQKLSLAVGHVLNDEIEVLVVHFSSMCSSAALAMTHRE
jgi:hypothetical protein